MSPQLSALPPDIPASLLSSSSTASILHNANININSSNNIYDSNLSYIGTNPTPLAVNKRLYGTDGPVSFPSTPLEGCVQARGELRAWHVEEDKVISQNSSKRKVHRGHWLTPYDKTSSFPVAVKFVEDCNSRDGRSIKREIECHLYIYQRLSQLVYDNNNSVLKGYKRLEDAWPCAEMFAYHLDKKHPGKSVLVTRKLSGPDFFDIIRTEHSSSFPSRGLALYECHKLHWCVLAMERIAQYARLGIRHNDIKPDNIVLDFYTPHNAHSNNHILGSSSSSSSSSCEGICGLDCSTSTGIFDVSTSSSQSGCLKGTCNCSRYHPTTGSYSRSSSGCSWCSLSPPSCVAAAALTSLATSPLSTHHIGSPSYSSNSINKASLSTFPSTSSLSFSLPSSPVSPSSIRPFSPYIPMCCDNTQLDVKLIDLGTASMQHAKDFTGGTSWYESPEQKILEYYTKKQRNPDAAKQVDIGLPSDAWGAGLSISEVLIGRRVVDSMRKPGGPGPLEYKGEGWGMEINEWVSCARAALGIDKELQRFPLCTEAARMIFDNFIIEDPSSRTTVQNFIPTLTSMLMEATDHVKKKYSPTTLHRGSASIFSIPGLHYGSGSSSSSNSSNASNHHQHSPLFSNIH